MARKTRRERRAPDPSQPPIAQIGALVPFQVVAFGAEKELNIILGDTASGQLLSFDNPIVENAILPEPIYYSIEGSERRQFSSATKIGPAGLYLFTDDPEWVATGTGAVWSPVWQESVRGNQRYYLAPFIFEFFIEP